MPNPRNDLPGKSKPNHAATHGMRPVSTGQTDKQLPQPMTDLHALTSDYQTLLEHHRRDPDCETTWELYKHTRAELEREWLEHAVRNG